MNLNLKDPFLKILSMPIDRMKKGKMLVKKYESEKRKALKLYGSYSVKKINWLQEKLFEAQNKINRR